MCEWVLLLEDRDLVKYLLTNKQKRFWNTYVICVERGGSEDQEVALGKHRAQERLGRRKVLYTGRTGNPGARSGGRRFQSCWGI